jgi:hypothetical protein
LRDTRVALPDKARQETQNEHLRPEKRASLQVYEGRIQKPFNSFSVRLILNHESRGFCVSVKLLRKS